MAERYVIDRDNHVWLVVRDGGMVTRAHEQSPTGITSVGIVWLESTAGPLREFDPSTITEDADEARRLELYEAWERGYQWGASDGPHLNPYREGWDG